MAHENPEASHHEPETPVRRKRSIFSYLKWIPILLLLLVCALAAFIAFRFINDAKIPYEVSTEGVNIPKYTEIELPFNHNYVKATQIQAAGGCAINLDGGAEELFLCGGQDQTDGLFRFEDGKFKDITEESGLTKEDMSEASMSATSLDVDLDGDSDLIVTRKNSIWLYTNDGGKLTGQKLDVAMDDDTTPASIAVADLNRDGHFDMFVCGYIKKERIEGYNIFNNCLLYTSPSPRDQRGSRMPSSA